MKKILCIICLIITAYGSKAQEISNCRYLYNAGYWKQAETEYKSLINSLDNNSKEYYIALGEYAELLYYMDKRILSDSLINIAYQNLHKSSMGASINEKVEITARYSCLTQKRNVLKMGVQKLRNVSIKGLINSIDNIESKSAEDIIEDLTPENTDNPTALTLQGEYFLEKGMTILANKNFKKAIETVEQYYGTYSIEYVNILVHMAKYYFTITNYAKMLSTCDEASNILNSLKINDGVCRADVTLYTAVALSALGNHNESINLHKQANQLYINALGKNHSRYARALYYQGRSLGMMGEYDKMLESESESATIYKKTLGEQNSEYAAALNEIGVSYSYLNDTIHEFEYYKKSLEINTKGFGEGSHETAKQYFNIAQAYCRIGEYNQALHYVRSANRIAITSTGVNSVFTADCLTLRALINTMLNKHKMAQTNISAAITIYENSLGNSNIKLAHALNIAGTLQYMMGKYQKANENCNRAVEIFRTNITENFSFMTSKMRSQYWEKTSGEFASVKKLCWQTPNDWLSISNAYNCELVSKGIELSSEIEFANIIHNSNNPELISQYAKLQEYIQQINAENELPIEERSCNTDSLKKLANKLEEKLVNNCQEYGDLARPIKVNFNDIKNSLKDNELAIEFIKSELTLNNGTHYGALLLSKNWDSPQFVELFTEEEFSEKYSSPIKPYTNTDLYEMVWAPMEKYLEGKTTIYFAPTGLLYNTAIEYAPINNNGETISEKYEIYRISSTRNLALGKRKSNSTNVAVYGGILYDTDTTTMRQESDQYRKRAITDEYLKNYFARTGGVNATYLPGTEKEAQDIVKFLNESKFNTTFFTQDKANEESFKNLSGQDLRIIHIATHGFYLEDTRHTLVGDNNLLCSGLLMSGCNNINKLPNGIDDGILTAREISYLDFRKTDMVVLSACETALGKVTDEGVYGLQRGFKKAGVTTIIMSLWPVNDYATKLLMTGFYKNMISGMNKRDSFLEAQRALRSKPGVNPSHWAAFIMLDGE